MFSQSWTAVTLCTLYILNSITTVTAVPVYLSATHNHIQYLAYIDSNGASGITSLNIFGVSAAPSYLYTFANAIKGISTTAVFSLYKATLEPSIIRSIPDATFPTISQMATYNVRDLDPKFDPGFVAAFAASNASSPGLKDLTRSDPVVGNMCDTAYQAIRDLEAKKGANSKATVVMEFDHATLTGPGGIYVSFETWGTPVAPTLQTKCRGWLGDLISYNAAPDDQGVKSGWRVIGKGAMLVRIGLGIGPST